MDFSKRSYQKELLDRNDVPFEDIRRNMRELNIINTWLGGHSITLNGIRHFVNASSGSHDNLTPLHICEIGCGGGDNLSVIANWCRKKNMLVQLTGIDVNAHCIEYARSIEKNKGIDFIASDYRDMLFSKTPDIIFCSLFCHHFTDEEIVEMLQWAERNSRKGFIINDLHRHPLAWRSISFISRIFNGSYLLKNDAPLSVLRGFKRNEWLSILSKAQSGTFTIKWQWAFRWLVIIDYGGQWTVDS